MMKFQFKKSDVQGVFLNFYDEEHISSLKILKSGWSGLYHCIIEWGEYEDADYELYDEERIKERFGIEIKD